MDTSKPTYKELENQIAELKRHNEILRLKAVFNDDKKENVFRQLAENIDDVFWIRTDEQMIYVNPAFEKIWGIPCEDIYYNPQIFTDTIHPEDKQTVLDIFKSKVFKEKGLFNFDYRIIRNDKDIRWINAKSLPVFDENGKIIRRVGIARDITERKQSVERIKALAEMLDIAPNSITIHDTKGNFLYANNETFEIHGYSKSEFLSLNLHDLDVPESEALFEERIDLIEKQGFASFEVEHYRKDKTTFPLEILAKKVMWQGKTAIMSIATDISKHKELTKELIKAKEKAEANESKLSLALKVAKIGHWRYEVATNKVEWFSGHDVLFGISIDEFEGTLDAVQNCVHPDDRQHGIDNLQKALNNNLPFENTYRVIHPSGEIHWLFSYGHLLKNEKGDNEFILGITQDITEQKEHEKELIKAKEKAERSEYKVRSMFENTQIGIIFSNTQGEILEANPAILDILGSPSIEASKKINLLTFPPLLEIGFAQNVAKCINEKITITEDIVYKSKWGKTVFMKYYLVPVIINENVIGVWANLNNLTDLWEIQNELVKSKEQAEESNRLKSAFLRNISHEFRTPMNGILGFTDLLIKPNKTEAQRKKYAEIVKESCERLLEIVTDTIDISEIQSNIATIKENQCSLSEILQEIIEQLKPKIDKKGLNFIFETNCNGNQLIIKSDKRKIQRSLKHLIDNAIKFTNSGKIELICESDNENICITINDTGIGISAEMQKVIFEPFRQVELDLCRNYGGNGVGLSLVKSYIEILGGTINLKSEINKGTSVKVTLPLNSTKTTLQEQIATEKKSFIWSEKNILIVEDEEVNYLYLEELLLETGSKLLYAKNGQEAVDFCRNNKKIDLILMDLKMPIMNGYEATKLIKEFRAEIPIIAQTAYALEKDIDKIKESGFDDYLTKPFEQEKLIMKIEKYI